MKHFCFFVLLLLVQICARSQDLVVTTEGDSIDCKITRVSDEFIHFSVFDKSGILLVRSRLPLAQVQYYEQGELFPEEDNENDKPGIAEPNQENRIIIDEFDPATFRLAINLGYTYQFGGYEGLPRTYQNQLKSLWHLGGEFNYFFSENIGIGAKYNHVFTNANEDFEPPISTAFGFSQLRDERVKFSYIALSLLYRNFLYDDQVVNYFVSGGIVKYRTDGMGDGVPFYQEGDTFGAVLGVSYDFLLMESFGIGVGVEVNIARLTEFDNNGTVINADFSLTRVDFTLGIRLYK